MRYEDRVIEEVQSLNDIVEVISGYLPLKRSGRTFKALCPFHSEKTPSFIVHPEKQIFHCFGCNVGGSVFAFLMKYENLSFPESLRNLAERAHYALPEPERGQRREVSDSESIYEVYRLAQEYYSANLNHPEKGTAARNYLVQRGFSLDVLKELPLGWATADWRGLYDTLSRRGIHQEALFRSGLVQRSREGNPYDLFRSRLLFPIHNLQGKVVAFGGRGLGNETPKYLNSPESSIFRKRKELFGLHLAKRHLSQEVSRILVVEGYFDFLQVYVSGFHNVVATLGTALTDEHVRLLKRFVPEVVIVFDGDRAGEAASLRGLEIFLEGEMNVRIVSLPSGSDPDTFLQKAGPEAFQKLVENAADLFDFKWQLLTRQHQPKDPSGLVRISNDFLQTFSKIRNPILLDHYLKRLASLLGVGEASLRKKLNQLQQKLQDRETAPGSRRPPPALKVPGTPLPEESILLALLLENPDLFEKDASLSADDFKHSGAREVFQTVKEFRESGTAVAVKKILNQIEDEVIKSAISAHCLVELNEKERERAFSDCLKKIRERRKNEKLQELQRAIRQAEGEGQKEQVSKLLREYRNLLLQKG